MEMKLLNINYESLKNINLTINSGSVIGIFGKGTDLLLQILGFKSSRYNGNIFIDNSKYKNYKSNIIFIKSNNIIFNTNMVKDEIEYVFLVKKLNYKNSMELIKEKLNFVNLDISYLKRKISDLSDSEKYLFNIFINILFDPKIIVFENIFNFLDRNNKKIINNLITKFKELDKILFITSSDINIIYNYSDQIILLNEDCLLAFGKTSDVLTNVSSLLNNSIDIPCLPQITYEAKLKKNIKLFYHNDVRDIIKDIYKHV